MPQKRPVKVVFHVFRHGERPIDNILAGNLTPRGKKHGIKIGEKLGRELAKTKTRKIVRFVASPVGRNQEFLQYISQGAQLKANQLNAPARFSYGAPKEKYKYGKIFDSARYEKLYGNMSLEKFNALWDSNKINSAVTENKKSALKRIRRWTEQFGSRISTKMAGQPVEAHVVVVSHGDVMGAQREHITGRKSMLGRQKTEFGEEVRVEVQGRRGKYTNRGFSRNFRVQFPKRPVSRRPRK